MQGTLILISTDGLIVHVELDNPPPLDMLQKGVGGHLEAVPHFDRIHNPEDATQSKPAVMFCNEEGKLQGLESNLLATLAWQSLLQLDGVQIDDMLVGDVVICTGDEEFMAAL